MKQQWMVGSTLFLFFCIIFFGTSIIQSTEAREAAPVIIDGVELFTIKCRVGSLSPEERARTVRARILAVAEDNSVPIEHIQYKFSNDEDLMEIIAGQVSISTITLADTQADGLPFMAMASRRELKIREAVQDYRDMRSPQNLLLQFIKAVLLTSFVILIFFLLQKTIHYFEEIFFKKKLLQRYLGKLPGGKLLPAEQVRKTFELICVGITLFIRLIIVYFYLSFVLGLFPWTQIYSKHLLSYIYAVIQTVSNIFLNYLPNAIIILIILCIGKLLLKIIRFFFGQLKTKKMKITGFYADWADTSYKIIKFFILVIMAISIFPYIPGSQSLAFQGVSVFLGVILSFGSSSVVSNVVAGSALTYTRAFEIGDRVKIGEHTGNIIEKSLLSTRMRTPKNEEITIPNSAIINNPVVNYSSSSKYSALILYVSVTLDYSVDWKTANRLLVEAALATPDVLADPKPYVLQQQFNAFSVSHEINVYTQKPDNMNTIYSNLRKNIMDVLPAAGIGLMTPHYVGFSGDKREYPESK